MNSHKNAQLTFARRIEMVQDIARRGLSLAQAALAHGVTLATARKWLGRYLAEGEYGLEDRSSRPARSPRAIDPARALAIVELRHRRLTQARIAASLEVSGATVSRVLRRAKLSALDPREPCSATSTRHRGSCCTSTPSGSAHRAAQPPCHGQPP